MLIERYRLHNEYRAFRGKPPRSVGYPWAWEIEKAVNRVTGRGINVAAWIEDRMQLERGKAPSWRVLRKSPGPRPRKERQLGGDT